MIARLLESLRRIIARPTPPTTQDVAAAVPTKAIDEAPADTIDAAVAEPDATDAWVQEREPTAASEWIEAPDALAAEDVPDPALEAQTTVEPSAESEPQPGPPAAGLVLRLESARGEPVDFEVAGSGATLGRAPENAIRLDDLSVSRRHARIAYRQRAYWLSDAGSVGGTWVDGTKLSAPQRLAEGQVIDIGMFRLTVLSAAPPAAKEPTRARSSHR